MSTAQLNSLFSSPDGEARLPGDWSLQPELRALAAPVDANLELFGMPGLWASTMGSYMQGGVKKQVKIAVCDTGCDITHPCLSHVDPRRVINFTDSVYGVQDLVKHGTWCTGIIGASGLYQGIASEASVYHYKVLDDKGSGRPNAIAAAIRHADEVDDIDILSCSFGGMGIGQDVLNAITAFLGRRKQRFIFASAGNNGQGAADTMTEPAIWPEVFAIGAADWQGTLTTFSSRGPRLDFVAPGLEVLSTIPVWAGGYGRMSGTSMAAPIAAGIGALILAWHRDDNKAHATPVDTPDQMLEHIAQACVDKGAAGRDDLYGFGMIDPRKEADLLTKENKEPTPANPPPHSGKVVLTIRIPGSSRYTLLTTETDPKRGELIRLDS